MMQLRSIITVADNSGAKQIQLIGIPKKGNRKYAYISDIITASVKVASPYAQVKKGEIVYAVIIRTKKECRRTDGSYIRFDDNACVILQSKTSKDPKGSRVFGPVPREIKNAGYNKIASLAEEIY